LQIGSAVKERYLYKPYGGVEVVTAGFGAQSGSVIDNPYFFTGRRLDDETGLYHFRNRFYHAELGRFVSRDFLEYPDGMNLYGAYFVPGGVDPSGLYRGWWEYIFSGDVIWEVPQIIFEGGKGTVQGGANIINGGQDGLVAIGNLPAAGFNGIVAAEEWVGILPEDSFHAPYIPSPEWARDLVTDEWGEPGSWSDSHGWGKFIGGTSALSLVGSAAGRLGATFCKPKGVNKGYNQPSYIGKKGRGGTRFNRDGTAKNPFDQYDEISKAQKRNRKAGGDAINSTEKSNQNVQQHLDRFNGRPLDSLLDDGIDIDDIRFR